MLRLRNLDAPWLLSWPESSASPWPHRLVLVAVGILSFFVQLNVSLLEGSEGLYAQIVREMVAAHEFFSLTFHGEPYINKPPMFFWMLGGARELLGESEVALRLPGALFALATMGLTYIFGCSLLSRTAGFWAAIVVATTHVFLWYGPRVLFDSTLTFTMTLAVFAWVQASLLRASGWWYLVAFGAMALGAMVKSIHAFAMPFAVMLVHALWQRNYRSLRTPWFWLGFVMYWLLTGWYASWLPEGMQGHFDLNNVIHRAFDLSPVTDTSSTKPLRLHWYLSMMWFDFFPWSALIPGSTLLMVRNPQRNSPFGRLLLLWFWGYLLMLSVSQFKREPYLMPLVPALALMIGWYYQEIGKGYREKPWAMTVNTVMLGLLAVAFIVALFVGPLLLERKWHIPFSSFPLAYIVLIVAGCLALLWGAVAARRYVTLACVGGLAVGFAIGVVTIILPALDRFAPKHVNAEVRTAAVRLNAPIFYYGIAQEDLIFYLNAPPPIPRLRSEADVHRAVRRHSSILLVTDYRHVEGFTQHDAFSVRILRTFPQPRDRDFYLLLIQSRDT